MTYPIVILPNADAEAFDLFAAYHAIQPSLGQHFLQIFKKSIASIQESPEAFSKVFKHSRRVRIRKFPYHIYYSVKPDRIVVCAVFHVRRDLTPLKKRES